MKYMLKQLSWLLNLNAIEPNEIQKNANQSIQPGVFQGHFPGDSVESKRENTGSSSSSSCTLGHRAEANRTAVDKLQ